MFKPLLILGCALLPALAGAQQTAVSGRVFSAETGDAMRGVTVSVHQRKATTDQEGRFALTDLPAGQHIIQVEGQGVWSERAGYRITLAEGQQIRDMELGVSLYGSVEGMVVDAGGKPMVGAVVSTVELIRNETSTDQQGRFKLDRVVPGTVHLVARNNALISARLGKETLFRATYYPSTPSLNRAQPIHVHPGEVIRDRVITVRMERIVRVSGRVIPRSTNEKQLVTAVSAEDDPNSVIFLDMMTAAVPIAADGTFELKRVLPGKVHLWLFRPPQQADGWGMEIRGRVAVTVPPAGLRGVVVRPYQRDLTVTGVVTIDGVSSTGRPTIRFRSEEKLPFPDEFNCLAEPDGRFQLKLPRGWFRVRLIPMESDVYMRSMRVNGREIAGTSIDLTATTALVNLEVLAGQGWAHLKGVVMNGDFRVSQAIVSVQGSLERFYSTRADQNGDFEARLVPGSYSVAARDSARAESGEVRINLQKGSNPTVVVQLQRGAR
jgi:hypothetical protein